MSRDLLSQIIRFGIVGALAFAVDYGTLMICRNIIGLDTLIATTVGFVVSVIFNYIASMRYVFVSREDTSKQREFVTFVVLSIIGLGINDVIISIGLRFFDDTTSVVTVLKIVATGVVMVWNFVSRKVFLDAG